MKSPSAFAKEIIENPDKWPEFRRYTPEQVKAAIKKSYKYLLKASEQRQMNYLENSEAKSSKINLSS